MAEYSMTLNQLLRLAKIQWHGARLNQPDWSYTSHSLALTAWSLTERLLFHVMLNACWEALTFELPPPGKSVEQHWRRWIDTALDSPHDICHWPDAPIVQETTYHVQARSIAVLFARNRH